MRAFGSGIYLLIALVIVFAAILPLAPSAGRLPGPDILLAVTMAYVIRRPDAVPVWVIALVFLFADLLLTRPPGLVAAGVVLASEYLRRQEDLTREVGFATEWAVAGSMIASVIVGSAAILTVMGAAEAPLGSILVKLIFTVLAYPVVVLVLRYGVGLAHRPLSPAGLAGRS